MSEEEPKQFDTGQYRNALGNFATGVTVVTACSPDDGKLVGVTANSFNSVSVDPPLVLWSLDQGALSLKSFEAADHFIVNVLAADQVNLSQRFARRSEDKFRGLEFDSGIGGAPLLSGCAASFECKKSFTYEGGDHLIFVGEVQKFTSTGRSSLVFHRGSYAVSEPHPVVETAAGTPQKGGFVEDYLDYLLSQAANSFQQQFQAVLDGAGVDRYEWRILCCLAENQYGLTLEQLSEMILPDSADLSRMMRGMEDKGWLAIGESFTNEIQYWITRDGLEKALPLIAAGTAHEADALGDFSAKEARQLKEMLKALIQWVQSGQFHPAHLSSDAAAGDS
jgi:flavin reductase (DIM6/NTAB) family NADH-FMN oxidoreductase RutF/DNA-binding MarR family transcriptional regulator